MKLPVVHHYIIHSKQADSCSDHDPGILTRYSFWYLWSCSILDFSGVTKAWGAEHVLSADTVDIRALVVYFHARYRKNFLAPTVFRILRRVLQKSLAYYRNLVQSLCRDCTHVATGVSDKLSSNPLSSLRDGVDLGWYDFPRIGSCLELGREMVSTYSPPILCRLYETDGFRSVFHVIPGIVTSLELGREMVPKCVNSENNARVKDIHTRFDGNQNQSSFSVRNFPVEQYSQTVSFTVIELRGSPMGWVRSISISNSLAICCTLSMAFSPSSKMTSEIRIELRMEYCSVSLSLCKMSTL